MWQPNKNTAVSFNAAQSFFVVCCHLTVFVFCLFCVIFAKIIILFKNVFWEVIIMHPFCHVITFFWHLLKNILIRVRNIPLIPFVNQKKSELIIIKINQRYECLKDGKFLLCSASLVLKIRHKKLHYIFKQ